ncbi:MAG: ribose-phosphate diphosphokinase [Candidatus Nanoarchaeia archaeon]
MIYLHHGDFAIASCSNGKESAQNIKADFEKICVQTARSLEGKSNLGRTDHVQLQFSLLMKEFETPVVPIGCAVFSDGEILPTIERSVREKAIYLIQNTFDPQNPENTSRNIMELLLTIDSLKRSSSSKITVILPYLSYSKQERRQGRQPISVKLLLDLMHTAGADKLLTVDLHAPATEGFTSAKDMTIDPLFASSVIIEYLKELKFDGVFVAPDVGAGKMVKHYSKVMNLPFALGYKFRKPDSKHTFETQDILGDVEGKDVAMIDDQIASGSTLIHAAKMLKDKGAKDIYVFATHGLFVKDAEKNFKEAVQNGFIKEVIVTNSLHYSPEFLERNPHIKVLNVLKLFSRAIYEMQTGGSISGLYDPEIRHVLYGEKHKI